MSKLKRNYRFATIILFAFGLFNVLNGLFHYLWFDSGAGSVAGMDLSGPAAKSLVFMLAVVGQLQVFKGIIYLYVSLKENPYILIVFWIDCISHAMALWLHYGPKHPEPLAPHRYITILFFVICVTVIVLLNILERRKDSNDHV